MPGDEVQEEAAAPKARGRTGPRHAAPRKPLLTRLHVPAGKAVAIAAMPSAVLMGMGLTPQLANAKPLPKNPFKGDACVSAPDKEETQEEAEQRKERAEKLKRDLAREKAEEDARKADGGHGDGGSGGDSSKPSDGPSSDAPSAPSGGGSSKPSDEPSSEPSGDTGSGSGSDEDDDGDGGDDGKKNPWYDPLGVGDKLEKVFKPGEKPDEDAPPKDEESADPSPSASPDEDSGKSDGKQDDGAKSGAGRATGTRDGDTGGSGSSDKNAGKSSDKDAGKAEDESADEPGGDKKKEQESEDDDGSDRPGVSEKDGTAPDYDPAKDAGKPFPCPEKTDVEGKGEQTPAPVPNQPWQLDASSLTLRGLDYEGVVNITMPNGKTKQALKFTADELDIGDLHQTVAGPHGTTYHVQAAEGSTSTIRGGKVTMYTEELKGNLFGLIPITFSPDTPPPINVPFAYFTKVKVKQAGQFGGNLTIPGLHQWVDK